MGPLGRAWLIAAIFAWALLSARRGLAEEAEASPSPPPSPSPTETESSAGTTGATPPTPNSPDATPEDSTPGATTPGGTPEPPSVSEHDPPVTNSTPPPAPPEDGRPGGAGNASRDGRPSGGGRPRPPRPSKAPPKERKWMLCEREAVAASYAEPLYVHCGVADNATGNARLELWFQRVGRFRSTRGDDEAVRNPFPRAPPVLLFVVQNGSIAYRSAELGGNYIFPSPADPRNLPLTVRSLTAATEGVYTWRRDMGAKSQRKVVTVTTHRAPAVSVEPQPALEGAGYAAVCRAAEYYPPRSTRLRWFRNGYPVEARHARDVFTVDDSGLFSRTSVLTLEDATPTAHPPNLRCDVSWFQSANMERRFYAAGTPAVYRPPELRVYFEGGEAVCEARCVPEGRVSLRWTVRDGIAPSRTEQTGVCAERPGLVNLRGVRLLSTTDGPVDYTCTATGYPAPLPEFSATATYDASPGLIGSPVLVSVVAVACGLGAVGLLLVAASCLRRKARARL
ncbi:envelope glycoprotein C [Bovine herpesvirus type 1.2 strain K22]|uniref:Envelope glycoprotein C n=55 Tax=Bovine herpesvirus 1 TaxID=10320 RepID=A0A089N7W5_BHV1K|nr:envelope glycoprotein C [Bovine herpesvirus type 1.2 strain K22]